VLFIEKICGMPKTIGDIIREQVSKSPLKNKEITDKLNRSENTIYNLYSKTSIDTDTLMALSEILEYDFFSFFYENPVLDKFKDKDVEVLIKDRDELKEEVKRKSEHITDLQTSINTKNEIIQDLKDQLKSSRRNKP
jgi:hypothetical protein